MTFATGRHKKFTRFLYILASAHERNGQPVYSESCRLFDIVSITITGIGTLTNVVA